jgi:hypothetical protein
MHVGERGPVIFDRLCDFARAAISHSDRFVDEYSVRVEAPHPPRDVLDLGDCVCLADELLVCHVVPFWPVGPRNLPANQVSRHRRILVTRSVVEVSDDRDLRGVR